jgi:hypothetical protein
LHHACRPSLPFRRWNSSRGFSIPHILHRFTLGHPAPEPDRLASLLLAEREVARRDPVSLTAWGFCFATLFWTVVQPWWSFPAGRTADTVSL